MSQSDPSELEIDMRHPGGLGGLAVVWLVPLAAIAVAAIMAWQALASRGPLIEITFANAEGVVENETVLKFRDVGVGKVEDVAFTDDLSSVVVSVRLEKDIAPFVDADARFWIVRPEISAQGVSGLATLLGGVYLEGVWDDRQGAPVSRFEGLSVRPLFTGNESGIQFVLSAPRGGRVEAGAPILFKGVEVGVIDRPVLSERGDAVTARAFVRAPYDKLITSETHFWGASGISLEVGLNGVQLDIGNLTSLLKGGVAFDTPTLAGPPISEGHVFTVYASQAEIGRAEQAAMTGVMQPFAVLFDTPVNGLALGAPVEYRGLTIGTVTGMGGLVENEDGHRQVLLRVDLGLLPTQLGLEDTASEDEMRTLIEGLVADGFRARLASSGLLGLTLKVEIIRLADAPPAGPTRIVAGRPVIPSAPPEVSDLVSTARTVMDRFTSLPFEDLFAAVTDLIGHVNAVIGSEGVRAAPDELLGLVSDLRGLVASDAVTGTLTDAAGSMANLRAILDQVRQGEALARLLAALERSDGIAASVGQATEGLPELMASVEALARTAAGLPLQDLVNRASALIVSANNVVSAPETAGLPADLSEVLKSMDAALTDIRGITGQIDQGPAVANMLAALERTDRIAAALETASAGLPDLVAQIGAVADTASTLPLEDLVTSANELVQSANALVSSDDTAAIPPALAVALAELGATLAELRDGGAVTNANAMMASATTAADAVAQAAAQLPELAVRLDALVSRSESVLAAYGERSEFNLQTLAALRDLRDTARAVTSLARTIERKPNSLLIGR
ncbi:MAG: MCE family protein [Rhodobacteraceae bacterium]|nr:MCE family protein [Paracoccaceae bacterium]